MSECARAHLCSKSLLKMMGEKIVRPGMELMAFVQVFNILCVNNKCDKDYVRAGEIG